MSDKNESGLISEEMLIRKKAKQALKKNKTPLYSAENEGGGLMSGPIFSEEMKKQAKSDV